MINPRIIVAGATGKTGSVVVTELLKAGYPVRALAHREDGRSALLKAQGAEIAVANNFSSPVPGHGKAPVAATSRGQSLEF